MLPVKTLRLTLTIIILYMACATAYAFNVDGMFSTAYEVYKDEGEDSESLWENYLSIDNMKLIDPYVGFNFYGRYATDTETDENHSDIYTAYLDYSSFQDKVQVKLGRFSYVGNRFLTLDGAEATLRTEKYVGATVFAGKPAYFDADGKHINESYRHTGDRLYGAKLFLNGVADTTGFISFSRETDDGDTLQEMLGLGLGRKFIVGKTKLGVDGKLEYDTEESAIYKSMIRGFMSYEKLFLSADVTSYDVKDGSSYENELIISNFSTGKEDRYAFNIQYAVTEHIKPYQSTVFSRIELPSGEVETGEMYKLGVDFDWFKSMGLSSNIEGYYYNSEISNAKGGSVALDWNATKALKLSFEGEALRLENTSVEKDVYSLYFEAAYDVLKDLTVSAYAENNKETRYLPENRYGIKAAYSF
jgi:hypothetical protein